MAPNESIEGNDEAIKYCTGLSVCEVFNDVLALIISSSPCLELRHGSKLGEADCLLLTLMKLWLNCHIKDLAFRLMLQYQLYPILFIHG